MRALVKTERGDGHLALLDWSDPVPEAGWVSIAVTYGGICGTDLHILHDHFPYWPPVILGHEFVGTVAGVGTGVDPGLLGVRVVSEPHSGACGTCHLCRRGMAELCPEKRSPGWGIDGAFASLVTLPVHLLHRVPDGIPDRTAALAEPMAVAVTALMRGRVEPGDTVLVIGPGPVGILLAVAARAVGAAEVIVVGREPSDRLRFAGSLGFRTTTTDAAEALTRERTADRGADLVVEAAGTEAAIALARAAVRRRGRIAAVAISGRPEVTVHWDLAVSQAVDIAFSMSSSGTAWDPGLHAGRWA